MGQVCNNCGYERQAIDAGAPAHNCPQCGLRYASQLTSEQREVQQRMARTNAAMRWRRPATDRGFFSFGTLITPLLAQITFIVGTIVFALSGFVALMAGKWAMAGAALLGILFLRVALEAAVVVFRLAEDVGVLREIAAHKMAEP